MLNFGASKSRVKGGTRAPGAPPWIRDMLENYYLLDTELRYIRLFMEILCTEVLIFRCSKIL